MHISRYDSATASIYIYIHACISDIYMNACTYIYIHACTYFYLYTYIHAYIYIYIYIYAYWMKEMYRTVDLITY